MGICWHLFVGLPRPTEKENVYYMLCTKQTFIHPTLIHQLQRPIKHELRRVPRAGIKQMTSETMTECRAT